MSKRVTWKSSALQKILLPAADIVTRQQVMSLYNFYRKCQWLKTDQIKNIQEDRLRETIQIAYEQVPFYRQLFKGQDVRPADVKKASDLAQLPPVSKDDLRNAYPGSYVRKTRYPVRELCTSGSSGQPFAVKIDNLTLSHFRALMFLRANFSGWQIGDPLLQTGMTLNRGVVKRAKDILLKVHYVSAFDLTDDVLSSYLAIIDDHHLEYIMGYPGSLYYLAKCARKTGFNRRLHGIVCWGDNLYHHYRKEMEEVFGCRVTDTYGCGEGIQVAAQCEEGRYHYFMPHVLVEVVDKDGVQVPEGELGEILLTRLNPGAMPLIRYRVGDLGRMGKPSPCPCGRGLLTMESIEGRDTDVVITPRGNRLIVHFFTGIFEYFPSIDTFKIIQDRPGAIRVDIVPRGTFKPEHWDRIKTEILEKGDPELEIEMAIVDNIAPEASNKRRFVISTLSEK